MFETSVILRCIGVGKHSHWLVVIKTQLHSVWDGKACLADVWRPAATDGRPKAVSFLLNERQSF